MLTKEECEKALDHFEKCYWDQDNSHGAMNGVRKDLDILNKLIHEHFDNPPLKFEELKEGMFIWDNKEKMWDLLTNIYTSLDPKTMIDEPSDLYFWDHKAEYEPNRFYRKEVVQE